VPGPASPALPPTEAALVAPVTPSTGKPQQAQPDAIAPTEATPRPPVSTQRRPPTRRLEPGDLICGECGEGNPPIRKFCSRCGTSLAQAETVRRTWWQRLIPRRRVKVHKAGSRPGQPGVHRGRGANIRENLRRIFPVVRNVGAIVLLLASIVYLSYPPFRAEVNERYFAAKNRAIAMVIPQYAPVRPIKVTATAALPDHPGEMVADGFSNTFWAAPGDSNPAVVFTFDHPVNLGRAIVRLGNGAKFQSAHRPQQLHLVFSNGGSFDLNLKDTPDPQEVKIEGGNGSTSVEIHVQLLFRSLDGNDVAITEIELFERK
jgi:hypothetical protein